MKLLGKWIANIFLQEVPTGTVNGVNAVFTMSQVPHSLNCVSVYVNGLILRQGTDYNISNKTITLTSAPDEGSDVYVTYIKA